MFEDFKDYNQNAIIKVFGVGGGGCNAVDRMIENEVDGVEFVSVNTDAQALRRSKADKRILIGKRTTGGQESQIEYLKESEITQMYTIMEL